MLLAIDTSTDQASVALAQAESLRAECSWTARGNHSRSLTPAIRQVLSLDGSTIADVSAIVVAAGPGSFNGLRVGLSEGKGLALALRIPLVGISTLDVIGFQASELGSDVWAMVGAGRNEICLAHYAGRGEDWRRVGDYEIKSLPAASEVVMGADLLAGAAAQSLAEELRRRGSRMRIEPPAWQMRRAGFLAELGRRYLETGGHDQLDSLEPLYLRRPAAEEKREAKLRG